MKRNVGKLTGISRGVGGVQESPFRGGGMDIFWNHTICVGWQRIVATY